MPSKEEKTQIKQFLKLFFDQKDNVKFYFLKKSKISPELEYIIPFKTRKSSSTKKILSLQKRIQKEIEISWEFAHWSKFVGKTVPESKVYKIPFLDTEDIEVKSQWRVCPIGEHWVRRHPKHLTSGKVTDHDGHCRKNPSKKDFLGGDEMDLIASKKIFLNPQVKVSREDLGLGLSLEKQNEYDELISGWTAYWNDIFQLDNPLHPNHVKALIATESTFNPKAWAPNSKEIGKARGLMQLTERATRWAKDHKVREYRNQYIDLEYEDLWDPNRNIAFGVRHLFRKRETAKWILKREPTWFEVLMDYKGRLKSKTASTKQVKDKLKKLFTKLGMQTTVIILTLFFSLNTFSANDDEFKDMYICFNIHQIKLNINYERVRWPNSQLNDVCDVSFKIDSTIPTYFYYTRGWHSPIFCKKFSENWNKLKEDKNRRVCIAARLDPAEKRKDGEKEFLERTAPYEVIKSGKWCHSYFGGYCN